MTLRMIFLVLIITCGLALRLFGLHVGLSGFVVKYGGSLLWGTMVFFIVALLLPARPWRLVVMLALVIAILVELIRLIHTPWLDDFRVTMAGALLLGRIFSPWNMAAYAIGIVLGAAIDRLAARLG